MRIAAIIIGLFINVPISMYIQYSLLQAIHADRLLMFLFWFNIPFIIITSSLLKIAEGKK